MKKTKLLTLLSIAGMMVTACSGNNSSKAEGEKTVIGICQIAQFDALDAATAGFKEAVEKGLGKDNVTFDFQNASGDVALCQTIVSSFVSDGVDMIMANATPCLQAAVQATESIPILGTSVTDYGSALSIKNFNGTVGHNISGTSDLAPLSDQADIFTELLPEVKKVGLLYCSAESNSLFQVETIEPFLKNKGISTTRLPFSATSDLDTVLSGNLADLDAIYIPTDNTCANNTSLIDQICRPAKKPIVCGEEGMCKGCGVATLSIDYHRLGIITGEMAVSILKDGADISKMAIRYDNAPEKKFNKEICEELGINVPSTFAEIK